MPIHDWTRVEAGIIHSFHTAWIIHLTERMNEGILPGGYYALSEQVASRMQADVLTLQRLNEGNERTTNGTGAVAVLDAPPQVRLQVRPDPRRRPRRTARPGRRLVVRHVSHHQVVAVIEIVSRANKDRRDSVRDFARKVIECLEGGVRVLVIDLFPPGPRDPHGMHGAIWAAFDRTPYDPPPDCPLTVVSYNWDGQLPEAFIEPTAVGQVLRDMPLFLNADHYVNVPLETTYQAAFRGVPDFLRDVLTEPIT